MNPTHPLIKAEFKFEFIEDPKIILAALLDFRHQWDKKCELIEEIKQYRTHCVFVHHHVNESIMNLPCREYIDKKLYFTNK